MKIQIDNIGSITDGTSGEFCSKEELSNKINNRVNNLQALGIKKGDKVLIIHGGTANFFADILAVWDVGACAACINPDSTKAEIEVIVNFIKPSLILINGNSKITDTHKTNISVVDLERQSNKKNTNMCVVNGSIDDEALILFTSGTTGVPKGVVHTFRSILSRISLNQLMIPKSDMRNTLSPLPTHFGHGLIGNSLTPLLAGCNLVLIKGSSIMSMSKLGEIIDKYKITFLSSVPAMWKTAIKLSIPPECNSLKRIHIGSAPLSSDLWNSVVKWSRIKNVVNMYGITETANWISGASAVDTDIEDGVVGKLWGGSSAVCAENGDISATGYGEIIVQIPSIMSGYYKLTELSNAVLSNGWFYTGDIGVIDEDGIIRLTGRKKFEINRAGIKIHPEDIDILLERHDSINEACAFAIPDPISGESVAVAVSFNEGHSIDMGELRSWCEKYLVREKVPEKWFVLDEIPKTDRGKVNRNIVAEACQKL